MAMQYSLSIMPPRSPLVLRLTPPLVAPLGVAALLATGSTARTARATPSATRTSRESAFRMRHFSFAETIGKHTLGAVPWIIVVGGAGSGRRFRTSPYIGVNRRTARPSLFRSGAVVL